MNSEMKSTLRWTAIACIAALPVLAENPGTVKDKLNAWFDTGVSVSRTAEGDLLVSDCFQDAEKRVPVNYRNCIADLKAISPKLITELVPEMQIVRKIKPLNDREALRVLMQDKVWSPETMFWLENMCLNGIVNTYQETGPCNTGRCDCVPCAPSVECDCKTAKYDIKGLPLPCDPPRKLCNVTIIKSPKTSLENNTIW